MKSLGLSAVLMSLIASFGAAEPMPIVIMSGKAISETVPAITFTVQNPGQDIAKTRVFTLTGFEIAELNAQSLTTFSWDGKDIDNQPVEAGLYVVQINHGGAVWHGPVMVNR